VKESPWAHGLSEAERLYFDEYKAAWEWRRLGIVNNACLDQRWIAALLPCEALASRDPGQVRT
jgi:hypothetical protein